MPALIPDQLLTALAAFPSARRYWVAYSGGMDSQVLLHALAAARAGLPGELRAAHVDHGLHPDAPRWAEHCRETCGRLGVPLTLCRVDAAPASGESPEAAARAARYSALSALLAPGDLLLTAQHQDDQAETLLLALLRGSGVKGLAAMPAVAPLGAGHLVRPLLGYSRGDLAEYAAGVGLAWIDDPANADLGYDRNLIRHRVLPLLAGRWPATATTIARSAGHCAEAQRLIDALAGETLARVAGSRPGTLSVDGLLGLDAAQCRAALRHWIAGRGYRPPAAAVLERVLSEVLPARADADPLVRWSGCEVRRYRDDLYALAPLPAPPEPAPIHWRRGSLDLPNGLGRLTWVDAEGRAIDPETPHPGGVAVAFGLPGLTCRPPGVAHHRRLKQIFQEAGVPAWLRPYVPLILAAGRLVAVGGICQCDTTREAVPRWTGQPWDDDWLSHLGPGHVGEPLPRCNAANED